MDAAALLKYMQKPEVKKKADLAKDKAWTQFNDAFPNADVTKFVSQVYIDDKKTSPQRYFSKRAPDFRKACSAQTEKIGARQ